MVSEVSNDELVQAVIKERDKRGWTDDQLANALGIDSGSLSRIKNGDQLPTRLYYEGVAMVFPELHLPLVRYMAERAKRRSGEAKPQDEV